jgi:uncharacterized protein (DUF1810 family)
MTLEAKNDPYNLARFVSAQDPVIDYVLCELVDGKKRSHWMWFIFPQIAGLGMSSTSRRYSLTGLSEAKAYLEHPILGERLIQCSELLLLIRDNTAEKILGEIDAQKLHSSMTLFARADPKTMIFRQVLEKFFGGCEDFATIVRL